MVKRDIFDSSSNIPFKIFLPIVNSFLHCKLLNYFSSIIFGHELEKHEIFHILQAKIVLKIEWDEKEKVAVQL